MTDEPNFVYIVQVLVNDIHNSTNLIYPESGSVGKYDASSIASYLTSKPLLSDNVISGANNHTRIKITVIERYGLIPSDHEFIYGTNINVFKAGMTNHNFVNWAAADYITGSPTSKWLTNFPLTHAPKVRIINESFRLMMINDNSSFLFFVKLYTIDDVLISTNSFITTPATKITILNLTPTAIIADGTSTISDFENTAYYTVGNDTDIYTYRININNNCKHKRSQRIHFLSQIGAIESFTFEAFSTETAKIKSSSYQKVFGEIRGNNYHFDLDKGTDIDYAKTVTNQMIIESDWLSEEVQNWLVKNLYSSPLVLQESSNYLLIRRMILETSYTFKHSDTDTIFREKIKIQLPTFKSATL
jgi:hypothetical protein